MYEEVPGNHDSYGNEDATYEDIVGNNDSGDHEC